MGAYSEDSLVEQPAIELFKELGWEVANCYNERFGSTLMQAPSSLAPSPQPSPRGRGRIAEVALGRETAAEVVLVSRLKPALEKLNPDLPPEAIDAAIEALSLDRSAMSPAEANRQIYKLLKDGVRVQRTTPTPDPSGSAPSSFAPSPPAPLPKGEGRIPIGRGLGEGAQHVRVKVIDWERPENNDFFLTSQLWLTGDVYKRRADLVGFVERLAAGFH